MVACVFNGPVFIVGLPRSGTKLLRDLLNQNPRVSIPEAETHFIPYFVREYGIRPQFDQEETFARFCAELGRSMFLVYMRERGYCFDFQLLASKTDLNDWSSLFEYVLRANGPKSRVKEVVFGDKTPEYLHAMTLLKEIFPSGRFVHIIRDPRDCCLSAARAWGLHPYGVADGWQRSLKRQRSVGQSIGDYLEVRYEALISNPEETLQTVCRFLECDFVPEMLSLERSNEGTGDAKGRTEILSDNMNKFWDGFSERQIKRIEEIGFEQMIDLGYKVYLAEESKPLHRVTRTVIRKRNALAFLRWKVETRGLGEGASYLRTRRTRRVLI